MAEPEFKTRAVDAMLTQVSGRHRPDAIHANICVLCGLDATAFDDEISRREYAISGMCQQCQDIGFAEIEE